MSNSFVKIILCLPNNHELLLLRANVLSGKGLVHGTNPQLQQIAVVKFVLVSCEPINIVIPVEIAMQ